MVELNALLMKMGELPNYAVQYPAGEQKRYNKFSNNRNNTRGGHGVSY